MAGIGGIGLHLADLEVRFEDTYLSSNNVFAGDNAFGYHLGAGVAVQLSRRATLGVDARRTFVPATFEGVDARIDGVRLSAALAYRL